MIERRSGLEHEGPLLRLMQECLQESEFTPVKPSDDGWIASGSLRTRSGYDNMAECNIEVGEFFGLIRNGAELQADHRCIAYWENGDMIEFDFERGCVVIDSEEPDDSAARAYGRLLQAMDALNA